MHYDYVNDQIFAITKDALAFWAYQVTYPSIIMKPSLDTNV
jgi:hypothetical protein